MNFSAFSNNCFRLDVNNCNLGTCCTDPCGSVQSLNKNNTVFLKLPNDFNAEELIEETISNKSFALVISRSHKVISIVEGEFQDSFVNLKQMKNRNIKDLEQFSKNKQFAHIIIKMVEKTFVSKKNNGFLVYINDEKYVMFAYTIQNENECVGIYLVKNEYIAGVYEDNII